MPSSYHHHISKMIDWIYKIQPKSVLDIGVGHGKWGFLAREYTDIFVNRYDRSTWETRIDGIEAFPTYATPTYDYIYNNVYFGDVRTVLPTLPDYDLVIIADVIEHLTKEDGLALLAQLRKKASYILISSPTVFFQQEILNNPFERHQSLWGWRDFEQFEFDYDEIEHAIFVAILKGDRPTTVDLKLDSRPARLVYSLGWARRKPKLAQLLKTYARHLPGGKKPKAQVRSTPAPARMGTAA